MESMVQDDREMTTLVPADDELDRMGSAEPRPVTRQVVLLMLVFGIVASTMLAIVAILTGSFGEGLAKAIGTSTASITYGLLALFGTHRLRQRPAATLAKASVAASVAGLATSVVVIWAGESMTLVKLAWVGFIVAFATAHASFLQARRRESDHRAVRSLVTATQFFVAIAATMLCVLVVTIEDVGEGFGRLLAVVLLLDVMLNVLVPIVRRAIRIAAPTRRPVDRGSAGVFA